MMTPNTLQVEGRLHAINARGAHEGHVSVRASSPLPALFAWPARLLLMLIAFAGSAVYAISYQSITTTIDLATLAWAIGLAAATAWIGFGFLLLTAAQMKPRRFAGVTALHWADACLFTMTVGMGIKMIGVGTNLFVAYVNDGTLESSLIATVQLLLLVLADVVMGVVFVKMTHRLRLERGKAILLWIVALNGIFAAVLTGLLTGGGMMP